MNSIERELDKAGYDDWKLSSGKPFTFVKKDSLGKCPLCGVIVYDDELFVEEDGKVYHYACYNKEKSEK
ncbi:hypothetical protein PQE74_gp168 [Bacillus phage vB_BanS_Chewbecca]|uniref:Uncharacterized protein n=1 Tax=Bacillus phage vB_BanS_Chewbecca TaxID=2894786 RepID=A0AAE8YMK6_9CAUD|nr:hypothetical protein PQE74_gp168 [Bacillus phage vB_BanS_Chewbecca]UGO46251.1 hypothetical protein CHEWBECCA_168 [Bacillus phage vB_BanS_Chewbecca]